MKHMLAVLFVFLMMAYYASAESETPNRVETDDSAGVIVENGNDIADNNSTTLDMIDLTGLSVDDLFVLRDMVETEIYSRGVNTYFDIRRGDKGEEVAQLQERLKELGYYGGQISGKYDTETQKAMKRFEKANNLDNDGDASREDQAVMFSDAAIPKKDEQQKTKATTPPKPQKIAEDEKYAEYGDFDYTEVFRYPEKYMGNKVKLIGKVVQVLGDRYNGFQLRFATAGNDDIVFVTIDFDPEYNILKNDRMTIYGKLTGTVTYESIWNQSITIPSVKADVVILR